MTTKLERPICLAMIFLCDNFHYIWKESGLKFIVWVIRDGTTHSLTVMGRPIKILVAMVTYHVVCPFAMVREGFEPSADIRLLVSVKVLDVFYKKVG